MSGKMPTGGSYLFEKSGCADVFVPEDFNDEQRQMADTAEQFILNEVTPCQGEIEQKNYEVSIRLLRQAGELGLLLTDVPEPYGGLELDKATSMLITEKLGGQGGSFGLTANCHAGIGTLPLIYYGTDDQKARYLEKLATGQMIGAYCLTEPGSGSDALSARTTAILSEDGSHYLINGAKQFITNGGIADLFTVFAKVDKKHFTAFLVERRLEGVSIGPEENKMGLNGSSTTPVNLSNVKVPVENLLGEIGKGHKIAFNILNVGRLKLGVVAGGMSKVALKKAADYASERQQFGRNICEFGAIKEKLADMTAAIFSSEALVYRIAGMIDDRLEGIEKGGAGYYQEYQKGIEEYAVECAIAKVYGSETFAFVADESLQVFGGYGYIRDYPVEGLYRDERLQRIYEGTNEINRMLIPNTVVRRAAAGENPLFAAGRQAVGDIDSLRRCQGSACGGPYPLERALIENLRTVAAAMYDVAVEACQQGFVAEQELQLALADISIQLFALESAVLRTEKIREGSSGVKAGLLDAVVKVCAFGAREQLLTAARRAIHYIDSESVSETLGRKLEDFCNYRVRGLLQAKRELASATSERARYLF